MRILAISDVYDWNGYERIFDDFHSDVVLLAGDLTSDGLAKFWKAAVECIPAFQEAVMKQASAMGFTVEWSEGSTMIQQKRTSTASMNDFVDAYGSLIDKYGNTQEFLENRKRMHVDKFYKFLKHAGETATILVVEGDHDQDFDGDYNAERIERIPNCLEMSGKVEKIHGCRFLGLGYRDTHYLRLLKPAIDEFKGKVDVVMIHCEQRRISLLSEFKPKLIVRGHFGYGKYLIYGIPSVFTSPPCACSLVEINKNSLPKITQYSMNFGSLKPLKKLLQTLVFGKIRV